VPQKLENLVWNSAGLGYAWGMKPRIRATLSAAIKKRLLGVAHRLSERIHPTNASGNNTSMR